jgi:hypothetical protein
MPFKKGQSGNPGGRPKQERAVVEAARAAGDRCIEVLQELVEHDDPRVQLAAADQLLNRGFGKPRQAITAEAKNNLQIKFVA